MSLGRRDVLRLAAAGVAIPLLSGCARKRQILKRVALEDIGEGAAPSLTIGDAESELVAGTSRYAFGLTDDKGPVVVDKTQVFVGRDPSKPPEQTRVGYHLDDEGLGDRGLYFSTITFPEAGEYFVAILARVGTAQLKGGTRVTVRATSKSPAAGQPVPVIPTPTTAKPLGADPLCSRRPTPCSMHGLSLDQAVRNGKPTVVVFAAPAFCQTELCGPDVEIIESFAKLHANQANFIHVEAYRKQGKELAPALQSFHFDSEPWTYFIDPQGVVKDRFSGAFSNAEVRGRLKELGVG